MIEQILMRFSIGSNEETQTIIKNELERVKTHEGLILKKELSNPLSGILFHHKDRLTLESLDLKAPWIISENKTYQYEDYSLGL